MGIFNFLGKSNKEKKVEKELNSDLNVANTAPKYLRVSDQIDEEKDSFDRTILASAEKKKFDPIGILEESFIEVKNGKISSEKFIKEFFFNSNFFVLTTEPPKVNDKNEIVEFPNIFSIAKNGVHYACLFSAPERAETLNKEKSQHKCAISVDAKTLTLLFQGRCGIVINVGWDCEVVFDQELTKNLCQFILADQQRMAAEHYKKNPVFIKLKNDDLQNELLINSEKADEALEYFAKVEKNPENLKNLINDFFPNIAFKIMLNQLPKKNDDGIEFDIETAYFIHSDNRPFLPIFTSEKQIEKMLSSGAKSVEELKNVQKEIVTIPGKVIFENMPRFFGLAINPGTDTFIPLG